MRKVDSYQEFYINRKESITVSIDNLTVSYSNINC